MHIYIPTYRRTDNQRTLSWIPRSWLEHVTLVCDKADYKALKAAGSNNARLAQIDIQVHPKHIGTIAQKRAWIMKTTPHERILMLDDDLRFARRDYVKDDFKLVEATEKDVAWALRRVDDMLDRFAHVGISPRQGNNNVKDYKLWKPNTRMIYALGYNMQVLSAAGIKYGRIEHREDMDYTLQLLRKGYENRVLVDITLDQTYNAKGGASTQRTVEGSNADAEKLARLHPGLVKVVEKAYERSVPRKEVVCYWRKAYAQGVERRRNSI